MNRQHPVYTEKNECQDCWRCVRNCPVKAIRVEAGSATVVAEQCIQCGRCVDVCPVHAKRVRDDLGFVRRLLRENGQVIASLAPSYVSEFPGISPAQFVAALRALGFAAVSETALGAQQVSASVAAALTGETPRLLISSACPVIVDLIGKYHPEFAENITQLCSPLLAHCRMLKEHFGADRPVVFIGPCIAKKGEADRYPELLAAAISFTDLRCWLDLEGVLPEAMSPTDADVFVPETAREGALYPVDGGMIAGIRRNCTVDDPTCMAFSGVENVERALMDLRNTPLEGHLFLELLACEGGCVNGPLVAERRSTARKRLSIIHHADCRDEQFPRPLTVETALARGVEAVPTPDFSETNIRYALSQVGKSGPQDELNCGGCGYRSCREFARALLQGKAETTMCASYMRMLAQKKANALMQSMPSGVVIVQDDLKIVECNRRFAEILGSEIEMIYDTLPGLAGAAVDRVVPFLRRTLQRVLDSGHDVLEQDIECAGRVYQISVFTIEPHRLVGGIIRDVTEPSVHKEQVIRRAQDVIRRQMETVQKIAYLLGENAAESQVSLNAIIDSFAPASLRKGDGNDD